MENAVPMVAVADVPLQTVPRVLKAVQTIVGLVVVEFAARFRAATEVLKCRDVVIYIQTYIKISQPIKTNKIYFKPIERVTKNFISPKIHTIENVTKRNILEQSKIFKRFKANIIEKGTKR